MHSYQQFTPGGSTNTSRMIKYITEYNEIYGIQGAAKTCFCIPNKYDKNTPGSDSSSNRISYSRRISQVINNSKGGKTQYGNYYLGESSNINYLGKIQGMPGGSGAPPLNRF